MPPSLKELTESGGCVGCYACRYACGNDSISFRMDERGFRVACVGDRDPGERCERSCPQLHRTPDGKAMAACYAVKAEPDVLSESSSGGAFTLLARWMLGRGGSVCGVGMSDDLTPTYMIARDESSLESLRGSKFAFSSMDGIYGSISEELGQGREVLFVGLPCQVQAVRNVFGENERLFTADIICNGMPSEGVYRRYLEELSREKRVAGLQFRSSDTH
ncbi:MAG: Coenzyme F420 hydrogenase/dehydrogenase, beta subunit C-terminal domain [Candidatus Methanomethylophilaceae archaeon]|nr:Coenzyme F420 hydrogenase/dehydrogenase, beta subunit C-terminal domain [Candidatus Methanomethylophilaceae archaeon]